MKTYRAFDLTVASTIPFPELEETSGPADVRVRYGRIDESRSTSPSDTGSLELDLSPKGAVLADPGLGRVRIADGTTITVDSAATADPGALRQLLLGPAFRLLLHQRGDLVLHASAVALDGTAAAFAGPSGAGKSTAAAACYANGYGLVADDIVAIRRTGDGFVVPSGFPRSKLHRSTACVLGLGVDDAATDQRTYHPADRGFPAEPLPLSRIYVFADGDEFRIEPVSPSEAVYVLARESFAADGVDPDHFEQCSAVARDVAVRRLYRPRAIDRLGELVETVTADLNS